MHISFLDLTERVHLKLQWQTSHHEIWLSTSVLGSGILCPGWFPAMVTSIQTSMREKESGSANRNVSTLHYLFAIFVSITVTDPGFPLKYYWANFTKDPVPRNPCWKSWHKCLWQSLDTDMLKVEEPVYRHTGLRITDLSNQLLCCLLFWVIDNY